MFDDFLTRQIRRTNRNRILLGASLVAILAIVVWIYRRDAYNFALGPFPAEASELAGISSPDQVQKYFLKVRTDEAYVTGIAEFAQNNEKRVMANFFLLKAGERLLLVRAKGEEPRTEYTGTLVAMPPMVRDALVKDAKEKGPELRALVLPVLLDAERSPRDEWIVTASGVVFFFVGVFFLGSGLYRSAKPEEHPARKALARYGDATGTAMQIESEMRNEGNGEKFGALQLTTNWVVWASAFDVKLTQMKDLVWAYQKVIRHYHTFIPVGKTFSVILCDRAGQKFEVQAKKDTAPAALASLQRRVPWIIFGHSADLERAWQKQRAELIAAVDKRRAEMSGAKPAVSREAAPEPVLTR